MGTGMSGTDAEDDDAEGVESVEPTQVDDVDFVPGPGSDSAELVNRCIPEDIRKRYEVYSYRSAALILSQQHPQEFSELIEALRAFRVSRKVIRSPGGNESDVPKSLSRILRPLGWHETIIRADLTVTKEWIAGEKREKTIFTRERYLDGHKVDYVKNRTAFDMEWNSKDQTFDRDLYAFNAFSQTGVIDVGVILTRGTSLTPFIRTLGPKLRKDGTETNEPTASKYGASTTWMGKLLYRLNAGRNGACPVLALGITPECVIDDDAAA